MSQKWQYGNYVFVINPNDQTLNYTVAGDSVRTLNGAYIVQPTVVKEQYNVSSVFYQPRSALLKSISVPSSSFVDYYNDNFYVLDKTNNKIDVYDQNFNSIQSTVSLSGCSLTNYNGFDVQSSTNFWVSSASGNNVDVFYNLNSSGSVLSTHSLTYSTEIGGIEYSNSYLYILRTNGNIQQVSPSNFSVVTTMTPIANASNFYGITTDGTYLIVGSNDFSAQTIYHIDTVSESFVNEIRFDGSNTINDLCYDGKYFYTLHSNTLQMIRGNTVTADLKTLEYDIDNNKYLDLVDDMGITNRVFVSSFQSARTMGFDHLYNVQLQFTKVDRG